MEGQAVSFEDNWRDYPASFPEAFEIVVTKTADGVIDQDWLEPTVEKDGLYFAENNGPVKFWMPKAVFLAEAPQGLLKHLPDLSEGAIEQHKLRAPASPGVAESYTALVPKESDVKQLMAIFSIDINRIRRLVNAMDERTGQIANVQFIETVQGCMVKGVAQDVMHVIGEVADSGEDCLQQVHRVP